MTESCTSHGVVTQQKWRSDDGMEKLETHWTWRRIHDSANCLQTECSLTSKPNIGRVHDCPTFWCEPRTGPDLSHLETFRTRLSESRPTRPQSGSLTSNTSCPDQRRSCLPGVMSMSGCEQAASHGIPAHRYNATWQVRRWRNNNLTPFAGPISRLRCRHKEVFRFFSDITNVSAKDEDSASRWQTRDGWCHKATWTSRVGRCSSRWCWGT